MTPWEHLPKEAINRILDKHGPKVYSYEISNIAQILSQAVWPTQIVILKNWLIEKGVKIVGEEDVNPAKG